MNRPPLVSIAALFLMWGSLAEAEDSAQCDRRLASESARGPGCLRQADHGDGSREGSLRTDPDGCGPRQARCTACDYRRQVERRRQGALSLHGPSSAERSVYARARESQACRGRRRDGLERLVWSEWDRARFRGRSGRRVPDQGRGLVARARRGRGARAAVASSDRGSWRSRDRSARDAHVRDSARRPEGHCDPPDRDESADRSRARRCVGQGGGTSVSTRSVVRIDR